MTNLLRLLCLCLSVGLPLAKDEIVVFIVDPNWDCVASYVKHVPLFLEYKVVKIRIDDAPPVPCVDTPVVHFYKDLTYNSSTADAVLAAEQFCPELKKMGFPVAAVIPTFDPATYLADKLSACLGVRGNPAEGPLAHARFDKWAMSESVRRAGLRSVKEALVTTWPEANAYLTSLDPPLSERHSVIFKVLQSSDSEGVTKVTGMKQAEEVFRKQMGTVQFGHSVNKMIIQEFFGGKEFVVDSVSRDGVHKTVMVWYEDLRPGNGWFNLYYGFKALDPKEKRTQKMIEYAHKVLTATGVQNGASDMEMFWLEDEDQPCVTDLNARWTSLMWKSGLDLEKSLTGVDQITATANALLDKDTFDRMPVIPSLNKQGAILFVMLHHVGTIKDIPGMKLVEKLPSYRSSFYSGLYQGMGISHLTNGDPDIKIELAHEDKAVVDKDYNYIMNLEFSKMFYDIVPEHSSFLALRQRGDSSLAQWLPTTVALMMFTIAVVLVFVRKSSSAVEEGTEYVIIQ
jgi:hypothetical protein